MKLPNGLFLFKCQALGHKPVWILCKLLMQYKQYKLLSGNIFAYLDED